MPADVVLAPIYVAMKALMVATAPLTALLATKPLGGPAIYDEGAVAQGAAMPYLTIGAGTQVPWHTMGVVGSARYGWNCTLQIKAAGQGTEASGLAIMSQVAALFHDGKELSLAGYGSSWAEEFTLQPTIVTTLAGVTTREWPAILRVLAHDTL